MLRYVALLLFSALIISCGRITPIPRFGEEPRVYAKGWVGKVVEACTAVHADFTAERSPIDCVAKADLSLLTLSFPDTNTFIDNASTIDKFLNGWCSSVKAYTDTLPTVQLEFRKFRTSQTLECQRVRKE